MWKIIEGIVPNTSTENRRIQAVHSMRHGRVCKIPTRPVSLTGKIQKLHDGCFSVNGPNLFNSLPKNIRALTNISVDEFKKKLDGFLSTVADEPQSPGYTASRRAASNSLIHMIYAI